MRWSPFYVYNLIKEKQSVGGKEDELNNRNT